MIRTRRSAFTLIEVVIASSITSIILIGMASAMVLASHAVPGRTSVSALTLAAGRATDQLSNDIACATSFSILGAGSIEMQVPDRTGDGLADTIRYAWSGTSGTPLYRTFRNGTAVAVANDVRQFNLGYVKTATKQPVSYTESGESLIFCTDSLLLYPTYNVTANNAVGVWFSPSYPANAAYLRVTRADFLMKSTALGSSAEVRTILSTSTSTAAVPSAAADYAKLYPPTVLANWVEATFSRNVQIAPGSNVAIALCDLGTPGNDFQVGLRNSGASSAALIYTAGPGGPGAAAGTYNWSVDGGRILPAYVYGVYGVKNPDAYNYNLTTVTCSLKCGDSAQTQIRTDCRVLNAPQVSGP